LVKIDDARTRIAAMSIVDVKPITAAEFLRMEDLGSCELLRGRIVRKNPPGFRHGRVAFRIGHLLEAYLESNDIGRTSGLDAGVITEHDPDTVRGADVLYYSYQRLPVEQDPADYPELPPEIIWEVLSPGNVHSKMLVKVGEYLEAGVLMVCVVDPERKTFVTYYPDRPEETIGPGQIWRAESILSGFELSVDRVFSSRRKP
jgi:Uma2 family endonuclease